jgi:inosine/xanthosine triphosphatase
MRVVVASTNPVKKRAALDAIRISLGHDDATMVTVDVDSGVPAQPYGDDETLKGARNRVDAARREVPDADLWVGLEGGVVERDGCLEAMAWIVVDGLAGGKPCRGESRTATFTLPEEITALVRSGVELGEASDRVLGGTNTKQTTGTVGPLTGGVIDRGAYYSHAMVLALIPFRNAELTFT